MIHITPQNLAMCILIGLVLYKIIKYFVGVFAFLHQGKKEEVKDTRSEWLKGLIFAEEQVQLGQFGYVNVEDILHEAAESSESHEEYYQGMTAYLDHFYSTRQKV